MTQKQSKNAKTASPEAAASDEKQTADLSGTDFEAALDELDTLVQQMENGDLTLNDSLKAFERGVLLARHCQQALQDAQLRVQVLMEDGELQGLGEADTGTVEYDA